MFGARRVVSVVLALALPIAASAGESDWRQVDTPTFRIYSEASEKATRKVAEDLEALHAQLELLKAAGKTVTPLPTQVFVFRNTKSFEPYQPLRPDSTTTAAGYFQGGRYGNFIAVNAAVAAMDEVVYHEYSHYFAHNNLPNIPLWLDEGLAEFFSTFQLERRNVMIGRPISEHLAWLRNNTLIPIRRQLEVDHSSPEYNEAQRKGFFYAQSWALTHYLLTGGSEKQKQLTKFVELSSSDETLGDAFETAFGTDFEGMERELRSYVKGQRFSYFRLPYTGEALEIVSAKIGEAEMLARLAELRVAGRWTDLEVVRGNLERALELDPEEPLVHYGFGRLAEREEDLDRAFDSYAAAIALEPDDFEPWFRYGLLELRRLQTTAPSLSKDQEGRLERARAALGRAIELRPDYGPGFHQLGRSYFFKPSSSGLASLSRARSLMPEDQFVLRDLATMYSLLGHPDRAYAVFDGPIARLATEKEFAVALQELVSAELQGVTKLVNEREFTQAHQRLQALEQRTAGGRTDLQDQVADARRAVDYNRAVDRLNRSRELAREGSLEEAVELLEEVLEITDEASLRDSARQQIETIGKMLDQQ